MNLKVLLLLFLVFFVSAITTLGIASDMPTPHALTVTARSHKIEPEPVRPLGDPIIDPEPPG